MLRTSDRQRLKSERRTASRPSAIAIGGWFWKRLCLQLLFLATLSGAVFLVAGGTKFGLALMVDPDAALWLPHYLPKWSHIPVERQNAPETLPDLRRRLRQEGFAIGEALPLVPTGNTRQPDVLLPLLKDSSRVCLEAPCQHLVELRVYQAVEARYAPRRDRTYFRLVDRTEVTGPAESFAIAPLADGIAGRPGSNRPLPLASVSRFSGQVPDDGGLWLNLIGERHEGDNRILYGQVYRYHPPRSDLAQMLQWTSPRGKLPVWQNLTGDGTLELLVDRSIGLEPDFAIYQIGARDFLPNPVQLVAVSLAEPFLDDRDYKDALLLARRHLWTPALEAMEAVAARYDARQKPFPSQASAQLDAIAMHARAASSEADTTRASPGEQVLANLMDGRWEAALEVFETADNRDEIVQLLKNDSGRLRRRLQAALRVEPYDFELLLWDVMVASARRDAAEALEQFEERTDVPWEWKQPIRDKLAELLDIVEAPVATEDDSEDSEGEAPDAAEVSAN